MSISLCSPQPDEAACWTPARDEGLIGGIGISNVALAPHMLLIPGTRTRTHLNENLRACGLWLEDRDIASLDAAFLQTAQ